MTDRELEIKLRDALESVDFWCNQTDAAIKTLYDTLKTILEMLNSDNIEAAKTLVQQAVAQLGGDEPF